ncbi:MAG: hypothetical protein ACLFQA_09765 [Bacteroidales bacterium]
MRDRGSPEGPTEDIGCVRCTFLQSPRPEVKGAGSDLHTTGALTGQKA